MERSRAQGSSAATRNSARAPRRRRGRGIGSPRGRGKGFTLVWVAILGVVLVGLAGLSLDWGKIAYNIHELQNSADAAALAGAQIVKARPADALLRARDLAFANFTERLEVTLRTTEQPQPFAGNLDDYDILVGRWATLGRHFIATYDAPNAVRVVARRQADLGEQGPPLTLVFGPAFDAAETDAGRRAIAWNPYSGSAGLICLSETEVPGLLVGGNALLDVDNGTIHVNSLGDGSNQGAGVWVQGSAQIDCGQLNVQGGSSPAGATLDGAEMSGDWDRVFVEEDGESHEFTVLEDAGRIEDPLKAQMGTDNLQDLQGLPPLNAAGITDTITASATLTPGYYPGGIRLTTAGETITLDPAGAADPIFVFGGGSKGPACGLFVDGGNLIGRGVTCYVTQSIGYGERWGEIRLAGNGTIELISPADLARVTDPETPLDGKAGIAVWQDPRDPNPVHLNGGGGLMITGTLYFPDPGSVVLEGNLDQAGNQIITGSASVLGRATITINYDGRNNVAPLNRSFLVW